MRILRLVLITSILFYLLMNVSDWLKQHIRIGVFVTGATIGVIDEYVMRLFPAELEPAAPGGFTAS